MAHKLFLFNFLILPFFFAACNSLEPPPPEKTITLTLEDISCIEAWIKLTTTNLQLPTTITLKQSATGGDQTLKTINLDKADTLLYIDSLLPNVNYNFQVSSIQHQVSSNELSVTTLDTTSHNFTWQTFEFGQHSSSVLYDVAIIDENNIWAVGEIYMNDSLGNLDPIFYNAAYWNGQNWKLKKIFYEGGIWTIKTIFAFSANDIWFSAFVKYDGQNFIELPIPPILTGWSINKIWGSSSNDLYVVGNNGNIAHYNESSWTKIVSGTDVDLKDIWGTSDGDKIFISGYSIDFSRSILLKVTNNTTFTFWENNTISGTLPYGNLIYSIRGYGNSLFISSNNGNFEDKLTINYQTQILFVVPRRVYKITVTNKNDIYTAGNRSNLWHYNGVSKKELYVNLAVPSPFFSIAAKGNTIIAVGTKVESVVYHKATIVIGRRI